LSTAVSVPADGFCGTGSEAVFTPLFNPPPPNSTSPANLVVSGANLAPGASCTFSITLNVNTDASASLYPNTTTDVTAFVDGATRTGAPATDDLRVVAGPKLLKEFIDDPVAVGGTATLLFTISYDGGELAEGDATNIAFTDDLNAASVLTDVTAIDLPADGFCGVDSQITGTSTLSFTGGSLSLGDTCTFSVTVQTPVTAAPGNHTNTTSNITASVLGLATTGNQASDDLNITGGLYFTKKFIEDSVMPGETATLEFTVENVHPTDDASLLLSFNDDLDEMLSGAAAIALPADGFCGAGSQLTGAGVLTLSNISLLAGTSCTFSVTVQIPLGTADDEYINVTAPAYFFVGPTLLIIDPAKATLTVFSGYLEFSKSFIDDPVPPGSDVTLEFTITNTHPTETATEIAFTDDLDAALTGLAATGLPATVCGGGTFSGTASLILSDATLTAGTSCTFTVRLQVPADVSLGTTATNITSNLTGIAGGGGSMYGGIATDDLQIGFVSFSKTMESPAVAGGTSELVFTIQNLDSSVGIDEVRFSDNLDTVISGLVATGLPVTDVCGNGSTLTGTSSLSLEKAVLDPSDSCTFTVTLQIPAMVTAGSYLNTTSDLLIDGLSAAIPATATLTIEPPPTFSKNFDPNPIYAEQTSTLLFTIDNSASALAATALDFTDNLPAGVIVASPASASTTCTDGTLTAVNGSNTISYSGGTVAAGASCTVQVDVTSVMHGSYDNTTGDLTSSSGNSGTANDTLTVNPAADLAIYKTDSSDPVLAGNVLTYTVLVFNNGPSTALDVVVTDTLPSGVTFVSTSGCVEDSGGIPTCTLGTITATEFAEFEVVVTVDNATSGVITNTAVVTSTTYDPDLDNNQTAISTIVQPVADLSISKIESVDPVVAGDTLVYTVTVSNNGPSSASNVVVTDTLPAEVTLISTTGCAEDPSGTPTCLLDTIASGADAQFVIQAMVDSGAHGVFTNTAVVGSTTYDPNVDNNQTAISTTIQSADLSISKIESADPVVAGDTLVYTVTVSNDGPSSALNVVVTDTLPAEVTLISTTGCAEDPSGAPTCSLGTIASGADVQFVIETMVDIGAHGVFTNTAVVASTTYDPDLGNNQTAISTTIQSADLSISKIESADPVVAGDTLVYTVTVSNNGPDSALNVVVTDTLPAEVTLISTTGCAEDPSGIPTCLLGTIASGADAQFVIETMVDGGGHGVFTNTAVVASTTYDPDLDNNQTAISTTRELSTIYLPVILHNAVNVPDLIVTDLSVSNDNIQIVIENLGNLAVTDAFWVDVYIDPTVAPVAVNQTWQQLGDYGAVWGVEGAALPILPGETLILTMSDSYYRTDLSQLPVTIAIGTPIYAQVDSANTNTDYGNVNEIHEINGGIYNNIVGPLMSE